MRSLLFTLCAFIALSAGVSQAETYRAQDISLMIETLGLDGSQTDTEVIQIAEKFFEKNQTLSCRGNGFSCKSSLECCSTCFRGVCGGETHNKPDGADCKSSLECKSTCFRGVCGGLTHDKPDGAECKSSIECKSTCFRGRCGGV